MTLQLRFRLSIAVPCTVLIASALVVLSEAQSKEKWSAPAAEAQKKNPVAATESALAAGQKIYSKTCAMCHGRSGDADGPAVIELNIHPAKLSDPKLATESDGALFWKITTGKKPMPTYATVYNLPPARHLRLLRNWLSRSLPRAETGFSDPFWRDVLLSKSRCIAHDRRTLKGNNFVTFPIRRNATIDAILSRKNNH